METISQKTLMARLAALQGATFAGMVTVTDTKAKKTNNPFGKIFKLSRINVTINFIYSNSVNSQMDRENVAGEFKAQERKWGVRIPKTPLVEHNGEFYCEAKPEKSHGYKYFYLDGYGKIVFLTKEQVKPFLPVTKKPETQNMIDKEIRVRDYKIASIRKININGRKFKIERI